jgi:nucleoside-diphosphate-sugar epimerase
VHLADQAGERYAFENPAAYIQKNLVGFGHILEDYRHDGVDNLVYAFRSSVYGGSHNLPFNERQPVNNPVNLYTTSKKPIESFFSSTRIRQRQQDRRIGDSVLERCISKVDAINRSNSEHSNIKI